MSRLRLASAAAARRFSSAAATTVAPSATAAAKPFESIPSPPELPFFGHLNIMLTKQYRLYTSLVHADLQKKFGDLVVLKTPHPVVLVFAPEDHETVFKNEGKYPVALGFESLKYYRKNIRSDLYPQLGGLLGDSGEDWHKVRSKVQQHMMRPKSAMFYIDSLQDVSSEFIARAEAALDANSQLPDNALHLLHLWALESVGVIFLNTHLGCLKQDLKPDSETVQLISNVDEVVKRMLDLVFSPPIWKYFPKLVPWFRTFDKNYERAYRITHDLVVKASEDIIKSSSSDEEKSLLEKFLLECGRDSPIPSLMAMDGLFAGVDTTAHTVAFLLYHLACNPEKQAILYDEIRTVMGDSVRVTEAHVAKMRYLKACLEESLRILPTVIGLGRITQSDMILSGYSIPAGSHVWLQQQVSASDPRNFPEPRKFVPERFLRGHPDESKAHPYAHMQFSHGPRMCVGRRFATLEVYLLTIKVLQTFILDWKHSKDMYTVNDFVNRPNQPLKIKLTRRA